MRWYVLRRLGASVLTLLLSSIVVFIGIRALPGSPAIALSGENASPGILAVINAEFGLDKPLPVQYADWIGQVIRGNLGTSVSNGLSVRAELIQRIPITFELAALALLVAFVIGIPAGALAAARRNTISDYAVTSMSLLGLSAPGFWLDCS